MALTLFDEDELKEEKLPKTWSECLLRYADMNKTEYIGSNSVIDEMDFILGEFGEDKNLLPVGMGKPMLAFMQLLVCREVYRDGWKPDWADDNPKFVIYNFGGEINVDVSVRIAGVLSFQTPKVRDEFLRNFHRLIEEAKELI